MRFNVFFLFPHVFNVLCVFFRVFHVYEDFFVANCIMFFVFFIETKVTFPLICTQNCISLNVSFNNIMQIFFASFFRELKKIEFLCSLQTPPTHQILPTDIRSIFVEWVYWFSLVGHELNYLRDILVKIRSKFLDKYFILCHFASLQKVLIS